MLWDFGLNPLHMDNPAAVEGKIQEIEDTFQLGRQNSPLTIFRIQQYFGLHRILMRIRVNIFVSV
jgi:hypothetical protein